MGFTPLEGLMMGTRSGSIDPAILTYIMRREGISFDEMDAVLNRESGVLGVSGLSADMRDVLAAADAGNEQARLAIDMYVYRVQKAIGGFYAAMTRTDAVVMTAGIGENSAELRELIFDGLAHMGMILDRERNHVVGQIGVNRIISIDDSPAKICVVTTDEEMRIARETDNLVSQLGVKHFQIFRQNTFPNRVRGKGRRNRGLANRDGSCTASTLGRCTAVLLLFGKRRQGRGCRPGSVSLAGRASPHVRRHRA